MICEAYPSIIWFYVWEVNYGNYLLTKMIDGEIPGEEKIPIYGFD